MTTTANEHTHQASPTQGPGRGTAADLPHPQVALLSNGSYGVVITDAGAGASTWRDLDVTRCRSASPRIVPPSCALF